jgi:hypothetical protein
MAAAVKRPELIEIPAITMGHLSIEIEGFTGLLCHNFDQKSRQEMADKQQGKARMKKQPKDPHQCFLGSLYPLPGKKKAYGFPASAFKKAMVSACRYVDGINMTYATGAFHVDADLIEIRSPAPRMREDIVRLSSGMKVTADLRYRGLFAPGWKMSIPVTFNQNAITAQSIANLLNIAGQNIGVGEWRPEKKGNFGRFNVTGFVGEKKVARIGKARG